MATYVDVLPGVDGRLEVRTGGFEFLWVVKRAVGAQELVKKYGASGSVATQSANPVFDAFVQGEAQVTVTLTGVLC